MKKKISVLIILIVLLFPIICNAKEDIEVKSVVLDNKTGETVQLEEPIINNLDLKVQAKFKNIEDSIKYKIVLKNNSDKNYRITKDSKSFDNLKYMEYVYTYPDNNEVVEANTEKELYVTIKYKDQVEKSDYKENKYTQDNEMYITLALEEVNPNTNSSLINLLLLILLFNGIVLISIKNKKLKTTSIALLLCLSLIPIRTLAQDIVKVTIKTHVEVEKKLFSFLIDSKEYYFEEGTTWREWIDTEYNVDNIVISDVSIMYGEFRYLKPDRSRFTSNITTPDEPIPNGSQLYWDWAECVSPLSDILVDLNGNTIKAKDIREGNNIVYYDEITKENKIGKILHVYIHKNATNFVRYTLEDNTYVEATDYHPIYTIDGWKSYTRRNNYPKPNIGDLVKTNNGYKKLLKIETYNGLDNYYDFAIIDQNNNKINNYYANSILVQGSY